MAVTVRLPGALRKWTDGAGQVEVPPASVGEVVQQLCDRYPDVGKRVLDENGHVQRFVNVFVNGDDMRFLQGTATALIDGDQLILVPAVAGGN